MSTSDHRISTGHQSAGLRLALAVSFMMTFLAGVGCDNGQAETEVPIDVTVPAAVALESAPTLLPTPTLAPGLPTAPPPPATLVPGVTPDTPTPTATVTPTATPTATPLPAERIELGQTEARHGDFVAAVQQFEAGLEDREDLTATQEMETLYSLGIAYLQEGSFTEAADAFNDLLAGTAVHSHSELHFFLGQAYLALDDYQAAIGAFQAYVAANPEMAAYVSPYAAEAYLALGDRDNAIVAYELALSGSARRQTLIDLRTKLAEYYAAEGDHENAALQYEEILNLADTERVQGRANYLAGYHWILSGDTEAGFQHYEIGLAQFPRAYESYLGLLSLVEADYPVDDFQRGVVDYYADMFDPAVDALRRYITAQPETYQLRAHLYLAWCYEALGDADAAFAELDKYAEAQPAEATLERAKMYARAGDESAAVTYYQNYVEAYPEGEQAPFAAWWAAALTERSGNKEAAITLYRQLGDLYDGHEDAPEALFRAGWLASGLGDMETARVIWQQAAQSHPDSHYGGAALYWLLKTIPDLISGEESTPVPSRTPGAADRQVNQAEPEAAPTLQDLIEQLVVENPSEHYYVLRAKDLVNNVPPFAWNQRSLVLPNQATGQVEAETWLRTWLELTPDSVVDVLLPQLVQDSRLIVGEKLWRLRLWEEAKWELESLRREYAEDGLVSYQLALYFRDLGLYRSSILAASSLLSLSGQSVFEVPTFIGRLIYPVYYADIILPLAESYGYDPLLQFALVRQESLFESFAHSGAAAQGLAQVIPDTGAYIAERLSWPAYKNEDLYKPYVGLAFGAYYLDQQLRIFDGHVHVALSAYNAGPGNAARWYEQAGSDHDQYLEAINFAETHLYVERIYVGHVIYRFLYR